MNKITPFLFGVVVGGLLVYTSLKYHVVRADDGFHLVPKVTSQFAEAYVDIRAFGIDDWTEHRGLAAALLQADKRHLVNEAAADGVRNTVDNILENINTYNQGSTEFRGS